MGKPEARQAELEGMLEDYAEQVEEVLYINQYECPQCGYEWEDTWSCACDDDCPKCGARHISPVHSTQFEPENE